MKVVKKGPSSPLVWLSYFLSDFRNVSHFLGSTLTQLPYLQVDSVWLTCTNSRVWSRLNKPKADVFTYRSLPSPGKTCIMSALPPSWKTHSFWNLENFNPKISIRNHRASIEWLPRKKLHFQGLPGIQMVLSKCCTSGYLDYAGGQIEKGRRIISS